MATLSKEEDEEPCYNFYTRRRNVLHDLFLRQTGLISPRRAARQLMRRLYTHGSSLRYLGVKKFKKGHFDLADLNIVARPRDAEGGDLLRVYALRRAEFHRPDQTLGADGPVLPLQVPVVMELPRHTRQQELPDNRATITLTYVGSCYPYHEDIPPQDYRPALFVLSHNVLSRYDSLTHRLLSQHCLDFAGASLIHCDIDYEADWLVLQSARQHKRVRDNLTERRRSFFASIINTAPRAPPEPEQPVIHNVFVVFKLHPFRLQRCFAVSSQHFPNSVDRAIFGTLVSVEFSGTFLLLKTSGLYTLLYDFSEFVEQECTGKELTHMVPGPLLLAVPTTGGELSLGGQGFFSSVLFGDSFFTYQLTSLEKMVSLTALVTHNAAQGGGGSNNVEDGRFSNNGQENSFSGNGEDGSSSNNVLDGSFRKNGQDGNSSENVQDVECRSNGHDSQDKTYFSARKAFLAELMRSVRDKKGHRRGWGQALLAGGLVRNAFQRASGPILEDLLQKTVDKAPPFHSSSWHFFPGNFNRLVLTSEYHLRIFELPPPSYYHEVSLNKELLTKSGYVEPPRPMEVTSSGRRVRAPSRDEESMDYHAHGGKKHFPYTVCHDYNLVFVLCVAIDNAIPVKLQSMLIYDIFTLKLLRDMPLDIPMELDEMFFDSKFELCVEDDTVVVVVHTTHCHKVHCFKYRHTPC